MALDFGMAKARGLVSPIKALEKDLIKKAGGDNVFKSEAWWDEQYDLSIKEGVTEKKTRTETTYLQGTNRYGQPNQFTGQQNNGGDRLDASYFAPRIKTINYTEQRGLTQDELNSMTDQSKETVRKAKREKEQANSSKTRGVRATGGLLSKAKPIAIKGMAAALPALGSIDIGLSTTTLG